MGAPKKKHQAGAAKNYITRSQAIRKLQISLADFRRLCIFKGIYPREPRSRKKANKGSTKPTTFYYTKDIQYLMHEPVIQKFRDHKIFARKLSRALGRGDVGDAKRLDDNRPKYKLDHIIKERYPGFQDALNDLDDPLSMLFLFAAMPAVDRISHKVTEEADRLCNQWMAYVAREGLLRKTFVSIKGVYYQANVKGQDILWLVPFRFPQNIPSDIDFKIMLTFLEFYTTLLSFVLYRLYTEAGLVYPPPINASKLKGVGGISAYVLESKNASTSVGSIPAPKTGSANNNSDSNTTKIRLDKALEADANNEDEEAAEAEGRDTEKAAAVTEGDNDELDEFTAIPATETNASDVLAQPKASQNNVSQLFSKFTFFIGREVPLDILEFIIIAFGGKVISESAIDELLDNEDKTTSGPDAAIKAKSVDLTSVTHHICDRPSIASKVPGRTYIQPQWVFDSINRGELLPVADYAPGETLPPHLSPWGDRGTYDPTADVDDASEDEEDDGEEDIIEGDPDEADEEEEEIDEEDLETIQHQKELEKEAKGVKYSEQEQDLAQKKSKQQQNKKSSKKRSPEERQLEEEKELRKMMMTNKQRKLYNSMQRGIQQKEDRKEDLQKKKRKIETAKKKSQK